MNKERGEGSKQVSGFFVIPTNLGVIKIEIINATTNNPELINNFKVGKTLDDKINEVVNEVETNFMKLGEVKPNESEAIQRWRDNYNKLLTRGNTIITLFPYEPKVNTGNLRRTLNPLLRSNINTIEKFINIPPDKLIEIDGIGKGLLPLVRSLWNLAVLRSLNNKKE